MPVILEANYSKKIGLPHYSSHQFMVTLRTEITNLGAVQAESDRLYGLLQNAVDTSLKKIGYLPEPVPGSGNGRSNGNDPDRWQCSDKQRDLILKIIDEQKLDRNAVDQLSQDLFRKDVRKLNKLEASGLIDGLLEQTGQMNGNNRFNPPTPTRTA